eukprot:4020417-Amphidinium_carterae.1
MSRRCLLCHRRCSCRLLVHFIFGHCAVCPASGSAGYAAARQGLVGVREMEPFVSDYFCTSVVCAHA